MRGKEEEKASEGVKGGKKRITGGRERRKCDVKKRKEMDG